MTAFMTMNVGYVSAVLAGVFFGELFFGRWSNLGRVRSETGGKIESSVAEQ
jgi:hypothetical protein